MQSPSEPQSEAESKDRFFTYFRHEVTALQDQMDRLNTIAPGGGERNDAIDHCLAGIDRLSHEVKDASHYIPAYDQRTYSEAIKALSAKLQTIRASFNPPKKFSFKTKSKNASALSLADAAELAGSQRLRGPVLNGSGATSTAPSSFAPTPLDRLSPSERKEQEAALGLQPTSTLEYSAASRSVSITGHEKLDLVLPPTSSGETEIGGRTATLSHLSHSSVDLSPPTLSAPFAALYLKNLSNSTITTGLVSGATHITSIDSCTLFVATRQFRMHKARNVDVYLQCGSRPIIEDCEGVRFAPLPEGMVKQEWGLDATNLWEEVDDFNWLKSGQSPNWSVLPESERVSRPLPVESSG
ncbi:hypothetical protein E8E13_002193 [Curvularia kusanoi]|uniref:C-CAP/cofactor C-like domain-containing protein n=1 Tax=Curvularia kusanoi TaxID=90978 RepID=A0A9P4TI94_CURKU|nr:hypothetical protein E8E13_002193 [Curvularia kusanoi]